MSRYDGQERPVPILDVLYPYAGPCAFCGFGDKRHRLADALVDYPDTPKVTAGEYAGITPEAVATLRAYREESRRRRRHRWEVRVSEPNARSPRPRSGRSPGRAQRG